jgi:hypothetical protein
MNMIEVFRKTIIEYKLCRNVMKNQTDIINELNIILKEQNGYKYNANPKKLKKHFPASVNRHYDEYNNYLIKSQSKNNKVSFSLSSKTIIEQIDNFLSTATRRYNTINMFNNKKELFDCLIIKNKYDLPILSPLVLRHNLVKYNDEKDINYRFPYFFDKNNRPFYDVIYIIKTENPHFYIDANNKTLCDTILICCNIKTFNILFELDIHNPYYRQLTNKYPEPLIKEIYNNTNI